MKKLGLVTIALGALLLSGCGGGGSKKSKSITEQMKEKTAIIIIHSMKASACSTPILTITNFTTGEQRLANNVLRDSPANTTNCNTYGRASSPFGEIGNCSELSLVEYGEALNIQDISLYEDVSTACVIAGD